MAHAVLNKAVRVKDRDTLSLEMDLACVRRENAGNELGQLRLAVSVHTRHTDNLTRMDFQGQIAQTAVLAFLVEIHMIELGHDLRAARVDLFIEISILEKQKQNENVQDGIEIEDSIKTDDKDDTQVIKKQQERIKKLQATIQSYKIANDNYKKEIEQLKRENIKLEAKNAEELRNKTLMEDTIEELNNEIHEQKQKLAKMGTEIEKYKNMYENAPKVLCFSKKEIDKEMFPFYNVEWICEWKNDYVETIDWIKYSEVWIAESDFSYSETKTIKNLAKGKVIIARNTNMLITKVGGNN